MLSRLRADKPCEFRPPCLLGNLAPNADCGPYGPKLRIGEGDHAAMLFPTRWMSTAILNPPVYLCPNEGDRLRLGDIRRNAPRCDWFHTPPLLIFLFLSKPLPLVGRVED